MPEFSPGEAKTAIAPIVAKPSGMDCEAELFLGPDELTKVASSGRVPFVSTGAAKNISLPITMPSQEGSYHGYIDVFAGGFRFLAYNLTEDVVIEAPQPSGLDVTLINPKFGNLWNMKVNGSYGVPAGQKTIGESCVFQPSENLILLMVQENLSSYEMRWYGPYILTIPQLVGAYDWDATAERMNGISALDLPATSNKSIIKGVLKKQTYPDTAKILVQESELVSGIDAAAYFIGQEIVVEVDLPVIAGSEFLLESGDLVEVEVTLRYRYSGEWVGENIRRAAEYPDSAYEFSGSITSPVDSDYHEYQVNVAGNVSPFAVVIVETSVTGTGIWSIGRVEGPLTDYIYQGYAAGPAILFAHPNPNQEFITDIGYVKSGYRVDRWTRVATYTYPY